VAAAADPAWPPPPQAARVSASTAGGNNRLCKMHPETEVKSTPACGAGSAAILPERAVYKFTNCHDCHLIKNAIKKSPQAVMPFS